MFVTHLLRSAVLLPLVGIASGFAATPTETANHPSRVFFGDTHV